LSGIISPVTFNVATHQAKSYTVSTPVYEGPLDLLLQLIERAELDITRLALAQVTDQYLEHLRRLQDRSAEEVSAFLVIAAKLLQIKSEALLPTPPIREAGEEDPGEALALQLIAYKRYRQIADLLGQRETAGWRTYLRVAPPPKVEGTVDLTGIGLADLIAAAGSVFAMANGKPSLNSVVAPIRVTIREKISLITRYLREKSHSTFSALLGERRTRIDIVVTFLAMLELVKRRLVRVRQDSLFGEIELEQDEDWQEDEEFELEFGE
jgi:segregation and condensation protein A